MTEPQRHFASDNYAPICPEAWDAMQRANAGHAKAYGEDPWTQRASDLIREFFEHDAEVFFVFNGTAANALSLATTTQPYHAVICHRYAHIEVDECGAPEFFSGGSKVLLADGAEGKVDPALVEREVGRRQDIHFPKLHALSLTQATELGTVYGLQELARLGETAARLGLTVHMDGARFANALASLKCAPADLTWRAGVDILCLGGTKNGIGIGEAVVFFDRDQAKEFDYRCKQAGQLCSKMRYIAAPWVGVLESDAFVRHASHANAMAARLRGALTGLPGFRFLHETQANSVFVEMPRPVIDAMHAAGWLFYNFIGDGGCRLMCAWDTSEQDVDAFAHDARRFADEHARTGGPQHAS